MGDPHTFSLLCPAGNIQLSPGNSPSALGKCEITCSVFYYFPDSFSKKLAYCSPTCFTLQLLGEHTELLLLSWHVAICGDEISWDYSHTITFLCECTCLLNITRSLL